jgi:hypothetical protein
MKKTYLIIIFFTFCSITKSQYDQTIVTTPTGYSVDALLFTGIDFDDDEIVTQNYNWTVGYNCVILANSTNYYNCH